MSDVHVFGWMLNFRPTCMGGGSAYPMSLCVFFYGAKEFKGHFETVTKTVPVPNTFPAEIDMVWFLEVHRGVLKKVNSTVKVYRIKQYECTL